MPSSQPSLFARPDTFFGVCQGLGEDLGFNPLYLRILFPLALFFYPVATIGGYFAAGALVLATRLLFPNPSAATAQPAERRVAPEASTQLQAQTEREAGQAEMPLAA